MMPTFPRSPLTFRTAGFPRYGCKAGLSDGAFPAVAPLKSAPDMRVATTGLHPPFVHSAARAGSPFVPGPQARSCTAMKWFEPQPQGSSLGSGLFCPGPSSLNRPHPPHSQAHRDFAALRFIRDAFAVRERLGDPRAVPSFRWLFRPDMPSSTSPVSPNIALSKVTMPARSSPRANRLDTHETPAIRFTRALNFGAYGFTFVTACQFARLPCRIRPGWLPAHQRLLRPGFRPDRSPSPTAGYDYDIAWTPMSAGLAPAGIAASFAALARIERRARQRGMPLAYAGGNPG